MEATSALDYIDIAAPVRHSTFSTPFYSIVGLLVGNKRSEEKKPVFRNRQSLRDPYLPFGSTRLH
jgi:hypothetical protein